MIPNINLTKTNIFSFGASVVVKHLSSLLNICTFNMKSNIFNLQESHQNMHNCKSLLKQILPWEKKLKTCQG